MKRVLHFALLLISAIALLASCEKAPFITMTGPRSFNFTRDGGSQSITFSCNRPWSVSSTESWVQITPSSGEASDKEITVTIKCSPNTTYDPRSATVTVKLEELSESITITQDTGIGLLVSPTIFELTNAAQVIEIEVQKNVQYSVAIDDESAKWIKQGGTKALSTDMVTFTISANESYDNREGKITFKQLDGDLSQTVTVRQTANLGIVLPTQSYDLTSDARTLEITVQANVQYTVAITGNWIKQAGTKGLTTDKLTFDIEENKTYDSREGKITIKSQNPAVADQVISVKQAQKDAILVEDTSFDMPYGGGGIEIKVEANVEFGVTTSEDWIQYIETKALSNSTIYLTVKENETYSTREGIVEITQKNGSLKRTVTIKQAGRIAVTSVELDQTSLMLKPEETATLVATVKPDNATDKTVTWTSSDSIIATVDETGKVTAVKIGSSTITAKAGEKTAECKVTVCIPVTSIELDNTELTLKPKETITLIATVKPDNTTDKTVTWTSSDTEIATVGNTGKVTAVKDGSATITAKAGEKTAECTVTVRSSVYVGNAVDLGFIMTREDGSAYKLLWADCNLGTDTPEGSGDYYAWGETETKSNYAWSTYKWANGAYNKLTKYCPTDKTDLWDGTGSPDGKTVLDPEDDVAHVKLGGKWRMPTDAEWRVLHDNCTRTWTTQNGVIGALVTSKKNGNSIFLPAAGYRDGARLSYAGSYGRYWSSSLRADFPSVAWFDSFYSGYVGIIDCDYRYYGLSVRPIMEEEIPVASIELNKTSLELGVGTTEPLIATIKPDAVKAIAVTWTSSDSSIASVDNTGRVTAIKEGTATITTKAGDKSAICSVSVYPVPDGAVDLGIVMTRADGSTYRLFWAKCNIGASKPEGCGNCYAWGETETKSNYAWSTYKWANGAYNKLTKYCPTDKTDHWDGTGSPDGKTVLDPEDDVAYVKLGGKWRMPTDAEWAALLSSDNCTLGFARQNAVKGIWVISEKNGNSIFLPGWGNSHGYYYGKYWSSSLSADYPSEARGVFFDWDDDLVYRTTYSRDLAQYVRAVSE